MRRRQRLQARATPAPAPLVMTEAEPSSQRGRNDHPLLGEEVVGFGTGPSQVPSLVATGSVEPATRSVGAVAEPNGAIPLAPLLTLVRGERTEVPGTIGDGLYGSSGSGSGDFDVYAFDGTALDRVQFRVAPAAASALDPAIILVDVSGRRLAQADDTSFGFEVRREARIDYELPLSGRYFLVVGGQDENDSLGLASFFDPASGTGVTSEGAYELFAVVDAQAFADVDFFSLQLRAGDVLSAALSGGDKRLTLSREDGERLVSTRSDLSAIYPDVSPLLGGGDAVIAWVVDRDGLYGIGVEGGGVFDPGSYVIEVLLHRVAVPVVPDRTILYLDFDGAALSRDQFPPLTVPAVVLSPLASFVDAFGLAGQETELIDAIVAVVEQSISREVRERGSNGDFSLSGVAGDFDIEVRNSRDHPDPTLSPSPDSRVLHVVVGGTIAELGLETVGIASMIDPGNFATSGKAVVLLDLLSAPAGNNNSLNGVAVATQSDPGARRALVAAGVGRIVVHEAGHLVGNFHTRRDIGPPTIMDRGGSLANVLGVGADGIWGTGDDVAVDLADDGYTPLEGLSGTEHTLQVVSFGLPAGGEAARLRADPGALTFGAQGMGSMVAKTITLSNQGTRELTIGALEWAANSEAVYDFDPPTLPVLLGSGEMLALPVRFEPQQAARFDAALRIVSDDPRLPQLLVTMTGTAGVPAAVVDPTPIDFGTVDYSSGGSVAQANRRALTVSNSGAGQLEFSIALTGRDPERFEILTPQTTSVAAGGSVDLELEFSPAGDVGDSRALLVIATNDPLRRSITLDLVGRGEGADAVIAPDSYFFGFATIGRQLTRIFRVSNRGTRELAVGGPRLVDDAVGEIFLVESELPATLQPAQSRDFVLGFRPTARAIRRGTLEIETSDPDQPLLVVELAGSGNRPEAIVHPIVLDFGRVGAGAELEKEILITNADSALDLFVEASIVGDPGFEVLQAGRLRVPAGEVRALPIRFVASSLEPTAATLILETNDPIAPRTEVPLRGQFVLAIPTLTGYGLALLMLLLAGVAVRQSLSRPGRSHHP